jgi:hypothetical protein
MKCAHFGRHASRHSNRGQKEGVVERPDTQQNRSLNETASYLPA